MDAPYLEGSRQLGTRRCYDVETKSLTLIQRRNEVVCTMSALHCSGLEHSMYPKRKIGTSSEAVKMAETKFRRYFKSYLTRYITDRMFANQRTAFINGP